MIEGPFEFGHQKENRFFISEFVSVSNKLTAK